MKWSNVSPKRAIDLIKQKTNKDHVYNFSMNKVKNTIQPPVWAKDFIQTVNNISVKLDGLVVKVDNLEVKVDNLETKVDNLETKVDNIEIKVDNNTHKIDKLATIVEQAHPELF